MELFAFLVSQRIGHMWGLRQPCFFDKNRYALRQGIDIAQRIGRWSCSTSLKKKGLRRHPDSLAMSSRMAAALP